MKSSSMKSVNELAASINMPTKNDNQIVVDEFAKSIINKVFHELSQILPAWKFAWQSDDPSQPNKKINAAKQQWTKAFVENNICTMEQISYGFAKARSYDSDFVPSCGKFISWCKPTPEDLGWPSVVTAMRLCVSHRAKEKLFTSAGHPTRPLIVELCRRVDWWLINSGSTQKEIKTASEHFENVYLDLLKSGYVEPEQTQAPRLETAEKVNEGLSSNQRAQKVARQQKSISEIRNKLKGRKNED